MVNSVPPPVLRLRDALRIRARTVGAHRDYIIEDPLSSRFYRIGEREHDFVVALPRGIDAALASANAAHPEAPLSREDGEQVLRWLAAQGLLEGDSALPKVPQAGAAARWLNPLILRLPLVNPDRWLGALVPRLRWIFSRPVALLWTLVVLSAVILAVTVCGRLLDASAGIFYTGNWFALAAVWIVVKCCHELAHGIVCKHYGGEVYEAGVILVLFLPIGYVDATSSWRFGLKRERIHVALAGMGLEVFIAALALWVWALTDADIAHDVALNTFLIAGVTTLFFNANPLMRFDGYFALADALDIPNLYAAGRRYFGYLLKRYLCGIPTVPPTLADTPSRSAFVRCYGVTAALWRGVVIVTLLVAASHLFHGLGVVLALLAAAALLRGSLRELVPAWQATTAGQRLQAAARGGLIVALMGAAAYTVTWEERIRAPAIVRQGGVESVRAETAGFVASIAVRPGDRVEAGRPVAHLHNPELDLTRRILALELERVRLEERRARQAGDLARAATVRSRADELAAELSTLTADVAALRVVAPRHGIVAHSDPDSLLGTFIGADNEILRILDPDNKRIHVSIEESDLERIQPQTARVYFPGRTARSVRLDDNAPRASRRVSDRRLAASHGGPLTVRSHQDAADNHELHYLDARVEWRGSLAGQADSELLDGEIGVAVLRGRAVSAAARAQRFLSRWLAHLLEVPQDA